MGKAGAYRAEQVGSLLRPPELLKARADFAEGKISEVDLHEEEDRSILDILHLQRQCGIDVLTDGEYRRGAWMTDMADAVEGFVTQSATMHWKGPGGGDYPSASHIVGGKLQPRGRLAGEQVEFLQKHAAGQLFKITLPSPSGFMISSYRPAVSGQAYASAVEMSMALAGVVREEIAALVAEGVPYIQLDTPQYSYFGDPNMAAEIRLAGLKPEEALDAAITADNACFEGLDLSGVTTAMHICRGNSRSRWLAEGGYDAFAEKLFGQLKVDRLLLEYDTARAGNFAPLRYVTSEKMVVLGLLTTKESRLEDKDELKHRIDQAARIVPLERLALSPQCGFASVATGNLIEWDDQRRKLELIVETANEVWG